MERNLIDLINTYNGASRYRIVDAIIVPRDHVWNAHSICTRCGTDAAELRLSVACGADAAELDR